MRGSPVSCVLPANCGLVSMETCHLTGVRVPRPLAFPKRTQIRPKTKNPLRTLCPTVGWSLILRTIWRLGDSSPCRHEWGTNATDNCAELECSTHYQNCSLPLPPKKSKLNFVIITINSFYDFSPVPRPRCDECGRLGQGSQGFVAGVGPVFCQLWQLLSN